MKLKQRKIQYKFVTECRLNYNNALYIRKHKWFSNGWGKWKFHAYYTDKERKRIEEISYKLIWIIDLISFIFIPLHLLNHILLRNRYKEKNNEKDNKILRLL